MGIPDEEFEAANRRGTRKRAGMPNATAVHYDPRIGRIVTDLSTGIEIAFKPRDAQGLEAAKTEDLSEIEISSSGLGIHFSRLDADLYLPALLEGFLGSRLWMASEMGRRGGSARTKAKAVVARENGRLGGRPKKHKELATSLT